MLNRRAFASNEQNSAGAIRQIVNDVFLITKSS